MHADNDNVVSVFALLANLTDYGGRKDRLIAMDDDVILRSISRQKPMNYVLEMRMYRGHKKNGK